MNVPACRRLRLVLGDQLNPRHEWFDTVEPDTLYLLAIPFLTCAVALVAHGVDLGIGDAEGVDADYVDRAHQALPIVIAGSRSTSVTASTRSSRSTSRSGGTMCSVAWTTSPSC